MGKGKRNRRTGAGAAQRATGANYFRLWKRKGEALGVSLCGISRYNDRALGKASQGSIVRAQAVVQPMHASEAGQERAGARTGTTGPCQRPRAAEHVRSPDFIFACNPR